MIKKLSLTVLAVSTLILSGCGGSSSSPTKTTTEQISDKKFIVILKGIASGICESKEYKDNLSPNFIDLLTSEEAKTVTCGTYGHTTTTCTEGDYEGTTNTGNVACVIGFNEFKEKAQKLGSAAISPAQTLDFVQSAYIEVAE